MPDRGEGTTKRSPRVDAQRNRVRLLDAAKNTFSERGATVSLEEIARAARVGIGTLYRHFPTRDALVEAVYRNETAHLIEAAERLAATHTPMEALREWMLLFADYMAIKQGMVVALDGTPGGSAGLYATSGEQLKRAMAQLTERAIVAGEIHLDIDPIDLLRAVAGVVSISPSSDWRQSARYLVDILISGLGQGIHGDTGRG